MKRKSPVLMTGLSCFRAFAKLCRSQLVAPALLGLVQRLIGGLLYGPKLTLELEMWRAPERLEDRRSDDPHVPSQHDELDPQRRRHRRPAGSGSRPP